jgi:exopolyphosphatase/guanosine-5'-triphosphate,3'-diphosphate pyrophosphatase
MGKQTRLFAAIDIGSHRLRMKIVQIDRDGRVRDLENVDLLVPLGRDTFSDGKLSFASVRATCDAIAGFKRLMTDYGVTDCRVVATSALREASNREYMVDQIRMLTGFDVEVINNSQEKFLTFQAVKNLMRESGTMKPEESLLVLDIGAGSIQLSLCDPVLLVDSQSMKIGALRIKEAMSRIEKHTLHFNKVLEEYIEAHIESVESFRGSGEVTRFTVVTGESEPLARLAGLDRMEGIPVISRDRFEAAFRKASAMSTAMLAVACGIAQPEAEVIAPALILIRKFFEKTGADEVMLPHITLVDGLIAEHVLAFRPKSEQDAFEEDILSNAAHLAKRYRYNIRHTQYVANAALIIYDGLRPIHGMGPRDRFLLQVAALLHAVGKYIGADPHYVYSYNIIKASQLAGLSDSELASVANIARFHSAEEPAFDSDSLKKLDTGDRIKAMKLIAIIRLADALDTSHRQKIGNLRIELGGDSCRLKGESREETALEQWTFQMKAEFFHEVFGMLPILTAVNKSGTPELTP